MQGSPLDEGRSGVFRYGFSQLGTLDAFLQREIDTIRVVLV